MIFAACGLSTLSRPFNLYQSHEVAEPGKGYAEKAAQWRAKLEETKTVP